MDKLQMIFCFETNARAGTDYIYIKDTIDQFYVLDKNMPINKVFMGGKQRYDTRGIVAQIKKLIKDYNGQSKVLFCVDTDRIDNNSAQVTEFNKIKSYCAKYNYEMIWFCHDIEEVYLGASIPKKEKVDKAKAFRLKKGIEKVDVCKLQSSETNVCTSNIMLVLDKYMRRKQYPGSRN